MRNSICITLISLFIGTRSFAQTGEVVIVKDRRIDALIDKQSAVIPPEVKTQIDGYRIQLFFDQDRIAVNKARSQFLSKYPKQPSYVEYHAPYFYLKVGDFRTHLGAIRIKSTVEGLFPTSFVIKEKIYLPPIEKQEIRPN